MLISRPERGGKRLFGDGGGDPNPGGLEAVSSLSVHSHSQGLLHVGHQEDVYWCPTIHIGPVFQALDSVGGEPIADYSRNLRKNFKNPSGRLF